jgi:hypothetical protein
MLYSSIDLTRRLWVLSFIEASLTEEIAAGEEAKNPVLPGIYSMRYQ